MTRVVLLAGASGSGKSTLCRRTGLPTLALDHFYRDGDDERLPRRFGIVDWDDPASWHTDQAMAAVEALCRNGSAEIPSYDIPTSRQVGTSRMQLDGAPVLLAEGVFAAELVRPCREAGLLADALYLRLHPLVTFGRRLARDLAESRKPPLTLVRRGIGLARGEPELYRRWAQAGCRPVSPREAEHSIAELADRLGAHRPGAGQ